MVWFECRSKTFWYGVDYCGANISPSADTDHAHTGLGRCHFAGFFSKGEVLSEFPDLPHHPPPLPLVTVPLGKLSRVGHAPLPLQRRAGDTDIMHCLYKAVMTTICRNPHPLVRFGRSSKAPIIPLSATILDRTLTRVSERSVCPFFR